MNLFLDGIPTKRGKHGGYVVDCVFSDDDGPDVPVLVTFDYQPGEAAQCNPDRPNPGPGCESSIELTSAVRKSDGREMNVLQLDFDEHEFMTAVMDTNRRFEDVAWLRKIAGIV